MSNEIKEILQLIGNCHYRGEISGDKYEEYCNYITNLQDKMKQLQGEIQNLRGSLKTYEVLLKTNVEENKRLKERENFKFNLKKDETKAPATIIKSYKNDYEDYKSRCEKAIPMLKELNKKLKDILHIGIDIAEIIDIENTLTGGDTGVKD